MCMYMGISFQDIPFEFASQSFAEQHAYEIIPQHSKEPIILDIDEDYFGCAQASDPLIAVGINWTLVGMQTLSCCSYLHDRFQLITILQETHNLNFSLLLQTI